MRIYLNQLNKINKISQTRIDQILLIRIDKI